jgi:maltooligosyltrehalose trehalohydrolase
MEQPYRVWAPGAGYVEIEFGDERHRMTPVKGGWWTYTPTASEERAPYQFRIDGGLALPDPRSHRQPDGVHGPSMRVDHDAFEWTENEWAPGFDSAILYELHIGTFTPEGTFDAAIGRLDHLVDLGITHVEVMPIAAFPGHRGWGYDGVSLFAPHESYGGPDGFKRFVDACHTRGLAVLLDVVYNHLGPDGNYLPMFGPYMTDRYATPWGDAVNFDGAHSPEVRRFFIDNALMWLRDYRVDGLRLDAVQAIYDRSALPFLEELAREVDQLSDALGRPLTLIAESMANDPRLTYPREENGIGLDAQWNDDFHHALHALLTGEQNGYYCDFGSMADLAQTLTRGWAFEGQYSEYRCRHRGRPATGVTGAQLVSYLQNHDQTGNRAHGERFAHLAGVDRQKIGAAVALLSPNTPMLFQGEEWAASSRFCFFTDHSADGLGDAIREGRRREFAAFDWPTDAIPDPQANSTFEASTLDWSELDADPHSEMLDWYRALIRLRRNHPALSDGRYDQVGVRFDESSGWFVFERSSLTIAFNVGDDLAHVPLGDTHDALLASDESTAFVDSELRLPPDSVVVLERA